MVSEIEDDFCACSARVSEIPMKFHDFQKFYREEIFLGSSVSEIYLIFRFFFGMFSDGF